MQASRIAIWNRDRVVRAIAISVWAINIAFLIQGKSRSVPTLPHTRIPYKTFSMSGTARVIISFNCFVPSGLTLPPAPRKMDA